MADNPRIEELRRRVQKDPASIAFAQLAEEYRRAGRFQEAIDTCRTGLGQHPGYLSARVTLGRALIETGDLQTAQDELKRVLATAPENLAALRGLAEIHHRRGELQQALAYYRSALEYARHDPELEHLVAQIARELEPARKPVEVPDGLSFEEAMGEFLAFSKEDAPKVTAPRVDDDVTVRLPQRTLAAIATAAPPAPMPPEPVVPPVPEATSASATWPPAKPVEHHEPDDRGTVDVERDIATAPMRIEPQAAQPTRASTDVEAAPPAADAAPSGGTTPDREAREHEEIAAPASVQEQTRVVAPAEEFTADTTVAEPTVAKPVVVGDQEEPVPAFLEPPTDAVPPMQAFPAEPIDRVPLHKGDSETAPPAAVEAAADGATPAFLELPTESAAPAPEMMVDAVALAPARIEEREDVAVPPAVEAPGGVAAGAPVEPLDAAKQEPIASVPHAAGPVWVESSPGPDEKVGGNNNTAVSSEPLPRPSSIVAAALPSEEASDEDDSGEMLTAGRTSRQVDVLERWLAAILADREHRL